jgi:hypothetical protein
MDAERFQRLATSFRTTFTRRSLLQVLGASVLARGFFPATADAAARRGTFPISLTEWRRSGFKLPLEDELRPPGLPLEAVLHVMMD